MSVILGIESSCDETGIAIVRDGREVLANEIPIMKDRIQKILSGEISAVPEHEEDIELEVAVI